MTYEPVSLHGLSVGLRTRMVHRNNAKPMDAVPKQACLLGVTGQGGQPSAILKSPLRYPGGKSRAVKQILNLLPPDLTRLCSPFVGGGSVELALAANGVEVYAYDAFSPLVNFWKVLLADAPNLARLVREHYPMRKTTFYALQKRRLNSKGDEQSAAVFFALNRSSFSGTTLSGGMSPGHPRFTDASIAKLAKFKVDGFHVERDDFKQSIRRHPQDFLYLDPPYCISCNLYGKRGDHHRDFDHAGLAELLHKRDGWLLSYNDCDAVRDLYNGYRFLSPRWTYGMNASKASNEVFILSRDMLACYDE